jgi:Flp pilus assembly protein TadG
VIHRHKRSAAAALELAVVLPFLALMFAAAVDFGRVFHTTQVLQTAASDGAMYASGTSWAAASTTTPIDAARNAAVSVGSRLDPPLRPDQVNVSIVGNTATVTVTYDFPLLTGFLYPNGTQLQRTSTVRVAPRPSE